MRDLVWLGQVYKLSSLVAWKRRMVPPLFFLRQPQRLRYGSGEQGMDRPMHHLAAAVALAAVSACTVERSAPDLRGQDVRLTLLHTSDIHSRLIPYRFAPG